MAEKKTYEELKERIRELENQQELLIKPLMKCQRISKLKNSLQLTKRR